MDRTEQKAQDDKTTLSPLTKDKTFGEKRYDLIFGNLINFWLNLTVSAGFTFFVNHAEAGAFKTLRDKQEKWTEALSKKSWVRTEGNPDESRRQAKSIVNVLTLLTPGHFVMIPSVWLGEKFKAPIVKYFDRKHYGAEAMDNADLKARHDAIAVAEKPTLLGTIMGRAGGAIVNIAISRTIGSEENYINKSGKKYGNKSAEGFKGIDNTADKMGQIGGEALHEIMPGPVGYLNKKLSKGMTYSSEQIQDWKDGKLGALDVTKPYTKGFDNLSRYFVQDIMYTLSTAAFVKPIVMGLRHILPGMTYKPELKPDMQAEQVAQIKLPKSRMALDASLATPPLELKPEPETHKPTHRISHIKERTTLSTAPEIAVSQG